MARDFAEFAELAQRFSRQMAAQFGTLPPEPPDVRAAQNVKIVRTIFSKWNLEIISLLYGFPLLGFEELRRKLRTISARVLSQKLALLQERGLVARMVLATTPVRVRYLLTERGLVLAKLGEPVLLYLHDASRRPASSPPATDRNDLS
ncbi:MAG: helix-turn-helix transcriptional regulator [Thermoplasmata archaeon]|nr:helix-turn-helix transcriptional regulator [Thermoplasmata archaeon]